MNQLILPATMENLERFIAFVDTCAREAGFDSKRRQHLAVAAEETIVNVIHYAYPEDSGDIEIVCELREDAVEIAFRDWGVSFNPLEAPEPDTDLPLEERRVGGMGILLVKKMIPELRYERKGRANCLTFVVPVSGEGGKKP